MGSSGDRRGEGDYVFDEAEQVPGLNGRKHRANASVRPGRGGQAMYDQAVSCIIALGLYITTLASS